MTDFIDSTPLTSDELAFQCLSLIHAALVIEHPAARESLLFVLQGKLGELYLLVK
ncbi:hypothetical protein [Budvicia diplopodorum]|uniref:hypothetical protein n=1 Tax=Budvicia diplopodorum TaxID=1119056 RepID=UPI00135A4019|nr:hypothetical protein [Budvicia diplopodorum]